MSDSQHGLRIRKIEQIGVRAKLPVEFKGSYYSMTHRSTVITRVTTESGLVGEAYVGDEDGSLEEIARITDREIAPKVAGEVILNTERIWDLGYPATFNILRDRRLGLVALAGVDAAVWDAVGKHLDVPLHQLWGGYRTQVPLMAIGGYYGCPLGSIAEEVQSYQALGLAGMKFKVGAASPEVDARRVREARQAAGPDFLLTVDANQGYTVPDAVDFARRVEDLDIKWFEEPVRWHNDRRAMRDVRMRTRVPVAAGQSEYSPSGCRDLLETGSVDVLNFDSSWSGGPTVWRRAAATAWAYDVRMGHHEEPQISSHLLASQPHGTYAECFHPSRDPFWWSLIADERPLTDGLLTLPDRPGLGWTLDEDYIAEHHFDLSL